MSFLKSSRWLTLFFVNSLLAEPQTDLFKAAYQGNVAKVKAALQSGADKNGKDEKQSYTALMIATVTGHKNVVVALINLKVDIDSRNLKGDTALILAARHGKLDILKELIRAKADVNAQNQAGQTALSEAFDHKSEQIAEVLIEAGADH